MNGLYCVETGPADGVPVVFAHGLLMSHAMFDAQITGLSDRFRCVAYDHRGQGRSEGHPGDSIDIETCTTDAITLLEGPRVGRPCHFVGLSMGGFVGMRIAARRPDLIRSLTLIATAPDPEPRKNLPKYRAMNFVARHFGVGRLLAARVMPIVFGQTFLEDPRREAERARWRCHLMALDRSIYKAVNGVIRRASAEGELDKIRCPTLVVWGMEDRAIARQRARKLASGIRGARWVEIPRAGHSVTIEAPDAVTEEIRAFVS